MAWMPDPTDLEGRVAVVAGATRGGGRGIAVALTPGWMRSELMLAAFGVTEETWRDALDPGRAEAGQPAAPPDFTTSETPRFVGRAVAALAADPDRARWNQASVTAGELARTYGFTDVDGDQPDCWRFLADTERGEAGPLSEYR